MREIGVGISEALLAADGKKGDGLSVYIRRCPVVRADFPTHALVLPLPLPVPSVSHLLSPLNVSPE